MPVSGFNRSVLLCIEPRCSASPKIVDVLIDLSGDNYRIMFLFSAFFMAMAGLLMFKVREKWLATAPEAARLSLLDLWT
ncbi:MAG: hypothetical protein ACNA8H_02870 [Anaerolineales bacterium]